MNTHDRCLRIFADISFERGRQEHLKAEGKFPYTCADSGISDFERYTVLGEEVGEVGHELNETIGGIEDRPSKLREELIQVAAVCVAWVEHIDKRGEPK